MNMPLIHFRQHNQSARIREGVQSGELTRGEARQLRHEQAEVRGAVRDARSDGVVTRGERADIRQTQNAASHDIYESKHDAQRRGETPRVDRRESRQAGRIHAGVESGQINGFERRYLGAQQRQVRSAEAEAKSDGVVTRDERHDLAALQNQASQAIFRARHNAFV